MPFALLAVVLWLIVAALTSFPRSWLYPDRDFHVFDIDGSSAQKARLVRWRFAYSRISFAGRVRHLFRRGGRKWRKAPDRVADHYAGS